MWFLVNLKVLLGANFENALELLKHTWQVERRLNQGHSFGMHTKSISAYFFSIKAKLHQNDDFKLNVLFRLSFKLFYYVLNGQDLNH